MKSWYKEGLFCRPFKPCLKWKCICFGRCNIVQYLNTPESYLGNAPNPSTMYFTPTGPGEVITIIQSFKTKKSTGDDGISMHILKQLCQSCSLPITNLINLSLEQGIVPHTCLAIILHQNRRE